MLDVRHLLIVDAIARAGTVTAAARRLHLTQPAVSHALGDLEAKLGLALFLREPRGMVLTPEGERLLRTADIVLPEIRDAEEDLRLRRQGYRGTLRITTECYTCYHWLPAVLSHYRERFPDIDVTIATDPIDDPAQGLRDGVVDIAVMHTPVSGPDLRSEALFVDELVVALPPGHPLADKAWLAPNDFRDETLILHADPDTAPIMTEFLAPAGVRPRRLLELRLTEAVLASVRSGLGITVMANWALKPEVEAGTLVTVPLAPEGLRRSWSLVTRGDLARRAVIQELARLLKDENGIRDVSAD